GTHPRPNDRRSVTARVGRGTRRARWPPLRLRDCQGDPQSRQTAANRYVHDGGIGAGNCAHRNLGAAPVVQRGHAQQPTVASPRRSEHTALARLRRRLEDTRRVHGADPRDRGRGASPLLRSAPRTRPHRPEHRPRSSSRRLWRGEAWRPCWLTGDPRRTPPLGAAVARDSAYDPRTTLRPPPLDHGSVSPSASQIARPPGPAAAVILAGGLASFALGLLSVFTAASATISDALTLSDRVGDLSGVTTAAT